MTVLLIEIMLHYYARCNQYRDGDFSAPAVSEGLAELVRQGKLGISSLVGQQPITYDITPLGRAYVDRLKYMDVKPEGRTEQAFCVDSSGTAIPACGRASGGSMCFAPNCPNRGRAPVKPEPDLNARLRQIDKINKVMESMYAADPGQGQGTFVGALDYYLAAIARGENVQGSYMNRLHRLAVAAIEQWEKMC